MLLAWVTIVLPLIMAAVPFFAPAPEAGKSFPAKWRAVILVLGVAAALCALLQMRADNRTKVDDERAKQKLSEEITGLRTVSPLRKQAADLAKELLDFYNNRESYKDRFKPGQALSDKESQAALKWYGETVSLYHVNYEKRIISVLDEIHAVTGMEVVSLESDAKHVKYAPEIEQTAMRLSAFAASLP